MTSAATQLTTPIQFIKGVGAARSKALSQAGIETVEDLLHYYPRRHLDRTTITNCKDLKRESVVTIVGSVKSCEMKTIRRGKLFQALIEDGTGLLTLTWFNAAAYVKKSIKVGDRLAIHGKVGFYRGFQIGMNFTKFSKFHLFLYLCTLEILPVVVMVKFCYILLEGI